ncbi:MAG: lantibiotic dehydratase family protein [Minicystis sp.]
MSSDHATLPLTPSSRNKGANELLFRPLETALLRAPLLSVDHYRALSGDAPSDLDDPRVRLALLIGSRTLFEALERDRASGHRDERTRSKLLRFLIRMSSRPTPYGMFAGVCLARLDRETDFRLAGDARRRIRPDMAWLIHLISTVEGLPDVRAILRVATNPAAYLRADRLVLAQRAALSESGPAPEVSIRATGAVRRALEIAERPVAYGDLRNRLLTTPGATPDKVDHLLASLLEQTFLLSDLRPPLTGSNPTAHVLDRLAGIASVRPMLDELRLLLAEASAWETLPAEEAIPAYQRLVERAERLVPRKAVSTPFQVDLFHAPGPARIHRAVGKEIRRAAELLLRLSPMPEGLPALATYRQAFMARYGLDREVPLLELLDGDLGLGSPPRTGARAHPRVVRREQVLLEIAAAAQRTLCPCVDSRRGPPVPPWRRQGPSRAGAGVARSQRLPRSPLDAGARRRGFHGGDRSEHRSGGGGPGPRPLRGGPRRRGYRGAAPDRRRGGGRAAGPAMGRARCISPSGCARRT